jgi:hypothetical protein
MTDAAHSPARCSAAYTTASTSARRRVNGVAGRTTLAEHYVELPIEDF